MEKLFFGTELCATNATMAGEAWKREIDKMAIDMMIRAKTEVMLMAKWWSNFRVWRSVCDSHNSRWNIKLFAILETVFWHDFKKKVLKFFSIQPSNKFFCRIYEYLRTGIITLRFFLSIFKNRKFKFSLERCEFERVVGSCGGREGQGWKGSKILIVLNNLRKNFIILLIIFIQSC